MSRSTSSTGVCDALSRNIILLPMPSSRLARIYDLNVVQAKNLLLEMKDNGAQPLTFLPDGNDISLLPVWVINAKQTTAGHLLQLAHAHGALLATLDEGIPGAYLIP